MLKGLLYTICTASLGGYLIAQLVQAAQNGLAGLF
jgi:hypothetical protein